jgi:hypothetical protein
MQAGGGFALGRAFVDAALAAQLELEMLEASSARASSLPAGPTKG